MYNLANASIYFYSIQRGTPHVNLRQKRASLFNSQILVVALIGIFGGLKPKMCVHFSKDWRSGISRYRNIPTASRAHSPVRPLFSIKTLSNPAIKSALPCFQCPPRRIPILAPPHHFFIEPGLHQVADYRGKRDLTEIHPAVPIIHGISPFQIHRIHLETYLQYFPDPCVLPTCPGISRYRITLHNRPQSAQSRNPFSPSTHGPIHS